MNADLQRNSVVTFFKDDTEPLSDVGPLNMFFKKIGSCVLHETSYQVKLIRAPSMPKLQQQKSLHDSIFEFEFLGYLLFFWWKNTVSPQKPSFCVSNGEGTTMESK